MPRFKIITIALAAILAGTSLAAEGATPMPKRRPHWMGNQGAKCPKDWPKPPSCDVPDRNYKQANGKEGRHLDKRICEMIKKQITKTPGCVFVIGYRSCKTNGSIRGAARNSFHLCGKAADLRQGTCGALGSVHTRGSAAHRHVSPFGGCY